MFNTLLSAVILTIGFLIVGAPWISLTPNKSLGQKFVLSSLLGAAISLSSAAVILQFGFNVTFVLPILGFVTLLGLILKLTVSRSLGSFRRDKLLNALKLHAIPSSLLFLPAILYSYLASNSLFLKGFSFRVGPDIFGWAISSRLLCDGDTITSLSERVKTQLGNTPLLDSLAFTPSSGGPNSLHISQITSFTDQAGFEFLIGAHRTGAPGFLAGLCKTGLIDLSHLFLGLSVWAVLLLATVFYFYARSQNVKSHVAALISGVLTSSFTILSVGLEGGFGQILTLPFFAFALGAISRRIVNFFETTMSMVLLIAVSCATYLDVLFFAGPFFILILIARLTLRNLKFETRPRLRNSIVAFGFLLLAFVPMARDLKRLVLFPLLHPTAGGWDQGRFPLTSNVFGLSSWLPSGFFKITERSDFELGIDVSLTVLLIILVSIAGWKKNYVLVLTLLATAYLTYSVYMNFDPIYGFNNYRLWKFGPYAVVGLSFLFWNIFSSSERFEFVSNSSRNLSTHLKKALSSVILVASLVASIFWSADWVDSRRQFMTPAATSKILELESKYDLILDGSDGIVILQEWAYLGDVHYGISSRAYGLPVKRTSDSRPLVIVRSPSNECDLKCAKQVAGKKVKGVKLLETTPWFRTYKVVF